MSAQGQRDQSCGTPAVRRRTPTGGWITAAALRLGVSESTVRRWIRTGRLNPSCGEVYAVVLPYLDRELSDDERAAVDRHLAACAGCDEHFTFDGTVLRFVHQRAPRPLAPTGVTERLLAPFRGRALPNE